MKNAIDLGDLAWKIVILDHYVSLREATPYWNQGIYWKLPLYHYIITIMIPPFIVDVPSKPYNAMSTSPWNKVTFLTLALHPGLGALGKCSALRLPPLMAGEEWDRLTESLSVGKKRFIWAVSGAKPWLISWVLGMNLPNNMILIQFSWDYFASTKHLLILIKL